MTSGDETGADTPSLVLYGDKGGVGKTMCAAAHALGLARSRAEALVVLTGTLAR
jgi:arsenite-transporting ATPase